jgi:uncharacterized protein
MIMTQGIPAIAGLAGGHWSLQPAGWSYSDGLLTIDAAGPTDLFIDPQGAAPTLNAAALRYAAPEGDWMLSATVQVGFGATYDAGVLLIWAGDRVWGKLCFEYSPQAEPMVVSVVTREVSDDANAFTVAGDTVALRVSRIGSAFAFHASVAGGAWQLIRHFGLPSDGSFEIGFVSQSPTGAGCRSCFSQIALRRERLADLRSGA